MSDAYDKAKWHYGGDFPDGLDDYQGYVHTGMFYGWLVEHDLFVDGFFDGQEDLVNRFQKRQATGTQVYEANDGVLLPEHLKPEGKAFADAYFDFDTGAYVHDYQEILCKGLPSMYHVQDSWGNYDRLRKRIDKRYEAWRRTGKPDLKKWWPF